MEDMNKRRGDDDQRHAAVFAWKWTVAATNSGPGRAANGATPTGQVATEQVVVA